MKHSRIISFGLVFLIAVYLKIYEASRSQFGRKVVSVLPGKFRGHPPQELHGIDPSGVENATFC